MNYNEIFTRFERVCKAEDWCNAFSHITYDDLVDLNDLLFKLITFCENIDPEELEDYECGDDVFKLYQLVDTLFSRSDRDIS